MKKIAIMSAGAALAFAGYAAVPAGAAVEHHSSAKPVTVTINGVQPGGGKLFVALQGEGNFLQAAGDYKTKVDADGSTVTATFDHVAPGSYVAAVVHDENGDGKIEMGGKGPTEAWGLSGAGQNGKPAWMPAMFAVDADGGMATVMLDYG